MQLALTLLAKNEADVIGANIAYHLAAGVDFVVATDNGSTDGTVEILEQYEHEGVLHLIREPSTDFRQGEWVTRMARLAADRGADWVINADADEFWWPRAGNLKEAVERLPERYGIVHGIWRPFVARPDDGSHFAERLTVRLSMQAAINDPTNPFRPARKAMHRAHPAVRVVNGNHDVEGGRKAQTSYPLFNMNGENYYQLSKANGLVDSFMIDSTEFDDRQKSWLESALKSSNAKWKIACFHHPLYSSGKKHGSQEELKKILEPILVNNGVKVALSGHDHFYERLSLKNGIQYFVSGAGGALRKGGLNMHSGLTAASYDKDNSYMVLEMNESEITFKSINRLGDVIDKGLIQKAQAQAAAAGAGF